jgi:hypothetical protein
MATDAKGELSDPRFAFGMAVEEAKDDEGEPPKEEQAIQQWTAGETSGNAEQRTLGSKSCNQDEKKNNGINSSIAIETGLAKCLREREQTAFLNHTLHYSATQGKHYEPTMQTVIGMPKEPAQALIVEDTAAWYAQSRQYPRKKGQQCSQNQTEDKDSFPIVHQPQDCRGR